MKTLKTIYYPLGLILIIILLLSIFSFNPSDSSYFADNPNEIKLNILGQFGSEISSYLFLWFGNAFYFSFLLTISIYIYTFPKKYRIITRSQIFGQLILILAFTILLSLFNPDSGGIIGKVLKNSIEYALGKIGVYVILFLLIIVSIGSIIRFNLFSISTYQNLIEQFKLFFSTIAKKIERKTIEKSNEDGQNKNNEFTSKNNLNFDSSKQSLFDNYITLDIDNVSTVNKDSKEKSLVLEENPISLMKESESLEDKLIFDEEQLMKDETAGKNFDPYYGIKNKSELELDNYKLDFNFMEFLNYKTDKLDKDFNFIKNLIINKKFVGTDNALNYFDDGIDNIDNNIDNIDDNMDDIDDGIDNIDNIDDGIDNIDNNIDNIDDGIDNINDIKEELKQNTITKNTDKSYHSNKEMRTNLRKNNTNKLSLEKNFSEILFEDAFKDDKHSYSNHPDLKEGFKHLRVSRIKEDNYSSETEIIIKKLENTLSEFNVEAKVTGISRGPVITRYEVEPAPGIKLSKIVGLVDNISLSMSGVKIRIIAPIPGKSAVGIEVPNKIRSIVRLGDVFVSDTFKYSSHHLPIVLGKDLSGKIKIWDLVQMPHLLIAGSTNSGKSVCVNSIICSLLYAKDLDEVNFILVDPKVVELKVYDDIPNLLTPVITEPKKAIQALIWLVKEMERRYKLLENYSTRNIINYNKKVRKLMNGGLSADEPLNYIVLIIDEFAALMTVAKKEVEWNITRLAAMSRAVGIHLILATQRPSSEFITGTIKANIPARVAFKVTSYRDSSIILDETGAEKLLGKGDMLFSSPGAGDTIRIQGTYISEEEVIMICENMKKVGKPNYIDGIFIEDEETDGYNMESTDEPLWDDAVNIVITEKKASASYLQRRLKIGYNRAARIIELMEQEGIVGPGQGSKPREILIDSY